MRAAIILSLVVLGAIGAMTHKRSDGLTDQQKFDIQADCMDHPKAIRCQ